MLIKYFLNRNWKHLIVATLIGFFCFSSINPGLAELAEKTGPTLRIGLMTQQFGLIAGAGTPFQIINADSRKVLGDYPAGNKIRIGLREGKFVLNNEVVEADRLIVAPKISQRIEKEEPSVELNNRRYRGYLEFFRTQGTNGITAVNVLPVDDYVYGLMLRDITPEWPDHSLKALAITIRTFALYHVGKHKDQGFDLCAGTDCNVYEGQTTDIPKAWKAVQDTRGFVVAYQGYPIAAFYHLSSGGYTENSENVLSRSYPYLRGVPDADQTSPYFHWQKRILPSELEGLLESNGYKMGALSAIELSKRTVAPMNAPDRGVSGRIKTITFIGKEGVVSLTGEQIQKLLMVPSSLFDLRIAIPATAIESNITDSYGDRDVKQIQINLPPASSGGLLTDREGIHRVSGQKNETIYLEGYGWGHGLGLSLWGAKAMAEKAINPGQDYYISILRHYYPETRIDKWY